MKTNCIRVAVSPVSTPFPALSAGGGEGLPTRLKVLSWGENPNARGKRVFVGPKFAAALASPAYPFGKVALDFEHNTVPGTPEYERTKEPRAVAGYGTVECVEGEGVFLNVVRWTDEGLAHARDYEDLSAAPVTDADGEVVALQSVALCRTGAVPGIEFVQCPLFAGFPAQTETAGHPAHTEEEKEMDYRKVLAGLLGLAETATDDEIAAAAEAAKAAKQEKKEGEAGKRDEAVEALSARVAELEKTRESDAKERTLLCARIEGKVVALSTDVLGKMTAEELAEHVKALPATVPLNAVTPSNEPPEKRGLSPLAADIARALGLKPEEMK